MILKFSQYIKEGRGISNIIKTYTDYVLLYFKDYGFEEYVIDLDDLKLPLFNTCIILSKGKRYGFYNPENCILKGELLYNIIISLTFETENELRELLTHELTHCLEFYNIYKWNLQNKSNVKYIEVSPKSRGMKIAINNIKIDSTNPFSKFKYLVYYTLDNEYNARVAQLYQFLKSFNSKDKDFLINQVKNSKVYSFYVEIDIFEVEIFIKELINKIELNGAIKITKELNEELKKNNINSMVSYNFINDENISEEDLYNYYNKWKKLFILKNEKHLKKIYRIVDEVINDTGFKESFRTDNYF